MKSLTSTQVLKRLRNGDILYPRGFASDKGRFDSDGADVSHQVIYNLLKAGKLERPTGTSIHNPFTLPAK